MIFPKAGGAFKRVWFYDRFKLYLLIHCGGDVWWTYFVFAWNNRNAVIGTRRGTSWRVRCRLAESDLQNESEILIAAARLCSMNKISLVSDWPILPRRMYISI